jgi:hypothetical protein
MRISILCTMVIGLSLSQDLGNYAADLKKTQANYCKHTRPYDNHLTEQQMGYYRTSRTSLLNRNYMQAFEYYERPGSLTWIQTMRWEFGCLMTLACISFCSWVFFIYFCFRTPTQPVAKNDTVLQLLNIGLWVMLVVITGLFIVIIIWNGFMEVHGRRSRC